MLTTREIESQDIPHICGYWSTASEAYLRGMGADINKMPSSGLFAKMLQEQIETPYESKKAYCIIWELDGEAVGHCNTNKIIFGEEAYMHLHFWNTTNRKKGMGSEFVKMSIPYFFKNLQIKTLYSEPYALNPAPSKTLEKIGFTFVKKYLTTPGSLNFEQMVNRWKLTSIVT